MHWYSRGLFATLMALLKLVFCTGSKHDPRDPQRHRKRKQPATQLTSALNKLKLTVRLVWLRRYSILWQAKYDIMNDLMSMGIHRVWKRFTIDCSGVRNGQRVIGILLVGPAT